MDIDKDIDTLIFSSHRMKRAQKQFNSSEGVTSFPSQISNIDILLISKFGSLIEGYRQRLANAWHDTVQSSGKYYITSGGLGHEGDY